MRRVFADSGYWIALVHRGDGLHQTAVELSRSLGPTRLITSELVLVEVLNFLAEKGSSLRQAAAALVDSVKGNPNNDVIQLTSIQFSKALKRYRDRTDKAWSLTDCASFIVMEQCGLTEALAHDRHFEQAGFAVLLRKDGERTPGAESDVTL